MTPKEKAKDLLCNFYAIQSDEYNYGINWKMAKQCALIAVDEILDIGLGFMHDETAWNIEKYWQEVKKEILNL
jgi:hypothetical protein